jgi:hypothetical protein
MQDVSQQVNIETLVLVAVWSQPALFQGCFKISPVDPLRAPIFLFFRCEYENKNKKSYVEDNFSPDEYDFSHLYNETHLIPLERKSEGMDYAEYVLKYALYKTLLEMRANQKQRFISIDDEAMKAIIKKVEPMLQRDGVWEIPEEHIGFAVAMDFHPQEEMGQLAVKTLFNLGAYINICN